VIIGLDMKNKSLLEIERQLFGVTSDLEPIAPKLLDAMKRLKTKLENDLRQNTDPLRKAQIRRELEKLNELLPKPN
jgi:hypothetical protein